MLEINCSESSNLKAARWNPELETLQIDFKDRQGVTIVRWEYGGFTGEDYDRFNAAGSKGRHFAASIRPLYDKGGARAGRARKLPAAAPVQDIT